MQINHWGFPVSFGMLKIPPKYSLDGLSVQQFKDKVRNLSEQLWKIQQANFMVFNGYQNLVCLQ